eukprot:COSAG01_NODE_6011_length_3902_cov_10.567447_6_plen_115_part_00
MAALHKPECDASGYCGWDNASQSCKTLPLSDADFAAGVSPSLTPYNITTEGFCRRAATLGMAVYWEPAPSWAAALGMGGACQSRPDAAAHSSCTGALNATACGAGCVWDGCACM